jgi:hypothetical protein
MILALGLINALSCCQQRTVQTWLFFGYQGKQNLAANHKVIPTVCRCGYTACKCYVVAASSEGFSLKPQQLSKLAVVTFVAL